MAGSQRRFAPQLTRFFASIDAREVTRRIVDALQEESVQNSVEPLGENQVESDGTIPEDGMDLDLNGDVEMNGGDEEKVGISRTSSSGSLTLPESIGTWGARIRIFKMDPRKCALRGEIRIEVLSSKDLDDASMPPPSVISTSHGNDNKTQPKCVVLMRRSKGSPMEWRKLFMSIAKKKDIAEVILN